MRRRRAGRTSPKKPEPSMSKTEIDNVGQSENREDQTNINNTATEEASAIKHSTAAKAKFKKRNTVKPNKYILPKPYESALPTPVQSSPAIIPVPATSASAAANANAAAIAAAANATTASASYKKSVRSTTASSAVSVLRATLPAATDESSSSDDESISGLTISHNPRVPITCIHTISCTKSYKPKRILSSPYRKTLLTLLCRVRTESTDSYAPGRATAAADRTQVYSCYQHHWNPKLNIPVLTLVACCNNTICQPMIERSEPDLVTLTALCSTPSEQRKVTFQIPLFSTLDSVHQPVILQMGPHHPLPDTLTSWFIKSSEKDVALAWIKIWNLSPVGCFNLHNHGILIPQRPFPEAEIHFLGLTAKRKMPHRINQLDFQFSLMSMLDPTDLGNVGYKKYAPITKPILPQNGTLVHKLPDNPIPRINVSPEWYYEDGMVVQPTFRIRRWPQFEPEYYPFPFNHSTFTDEFPDPVLLLKGEIAFRRPLILPHTTLDDMITEAVRKRPMQNPLSTLMIYFNFRREDVETKYMFLPFTKFLEDKQLPPDEHNGVCLYDAHSNGHNAGERYLVPKTWFHLKQHPSIFQDISSGSGPIK